MAVKVCTQVYGELMFYFFFSIFPWNSVFVTVELGLGLGLGLGVRG